MLVLLLAFLIYTASLSAQAPGAFTPIGNLTAHRSGNISGSGITAATFFDVRVTSPGSNASAVVLNWQRGLAGSHDVPLGTALGNWTINGVRAHQIEEDHTSSFVPVSATITVSP